MRLLVDAQIRMNGASVHPVIYGQMDINADCCGSDIEPNVPNLELYLDAVQRCVQELVNVIMPTYVFFTICALIFIFADYSVV